MTPRSSTHLDLADSPTPDIPSAHTQAANGQAQNDRSNNGIPMAASASLEQRVECCEVARRIAWLDVRWPRSG